MAKKIPKRITRMSATVTTIGLINKDMKHVAEYYIKNKLKKNLEKSVHVCRWAFI